MDKVFLDTSAQFSLVSADDADHRLALEIQKRLTFEGVRLIITDYTIDEVLTLITAKLGKLRAIEYSKSLPTPEMEVVFATESDFLAAKEIFEKYSDKAWSFTDCISFSVMRRLGIRSAFTFDRHFTQAGFNLLK